MVSAIRRGRRQRGMTMMEVMMAIIVATIGLLGSLAMVSTLFRGATFTRNMAEALSLVQSKLEIEVSRGSISLTVPTSSAVAESPMDALGDTTASIKPFTRTTTWSVTSDGKRRKVQVDVVFTDTQGMAHTLTAYRERNIP